MTKALLVAGLLLFALSGCSGAASDDLPDSPGDDGGRTSRGRTSSGGNGNETPHDDVVFLDAPLDLVAQDTQTFDVQVPLDVTIVDFHISSPGPATEIGALRVELDGCGVYDMGAGSSSGSFGGAMSFGARLCNDASEGAHTLTVTNTGLIQGKIRLTGQVPKAADNSTAAA